MKKTLPIFLAFFVMGFGDVVGTLVGFATKEFSLSRAMAGLLPFVGFIAFGLLSVPTGVLQDKKGKKFILILGLIIALAGLCIPSLTVSSYPVLLLAILMVGSGMAVLQVAGNPIMRDVSEEGKFSRNLAFAQFIKAIGSNTGPYVIPLFITLGFVWKNIFPVYAVVTALALLLVSGLKVEEKKDEHKEERATIGSSFALLGNGFVFMMVFSIFLYVGAEVSISSWIATYLKEMFALDINTMATLGIGFFFLSLMVGRLLGSAVLNWMSARKFFLITSFLSVIGLLALFLKVQIISLIAIFVIGLGFANIFPLVFSIAIDHMPEKSNELSGLMVMAIAGGAIMPLIMGVVADKSLMMSFLVPLLSIGFIAACSLWTLSISEKQAE